MFSGEPLGSITDHRGESVEAHPWRATCESARSEQRRIRDHVEAGGEANTALNKSQANDIT